MLDCRGMSHESMSHKPVETLRSDVVIRRSVQSGEGSLTATMTSSSKSSIEVYISGGDDAFTLEYIHIRTC